MTRSSKGTGSLFQDIRYAMRLMAGSPGYALVIVFVLALGIGATSLGFSLVNSIVLSPLPYRDASRLVMVHGIYHEDIDPPTSPPDFLDWKEQNHVFEQIAAYATTRLNIYGVDRPELVQGEQDVKGAPSIAIVNNSLAATFFPGESPIGKRITLQFESAPREIVGEVADVKVDALDVGVRPQVYLPLPQNVAPFRSFVVRGASNSVDLRPTVRLAARDVDSGQPISDMRTMDEILSSSVSQQRFSMLVMTFLAGLAAVLAAIGIYSVTAYSVSKRTGEIGIRMAMGAQADDVIKLILRRGIALTVLGIVAGLAGSLALLGVISSLLYGVRATDPSVFLIVTLGAAAVAILACYIPARKATRVDPIVALRQR